MSDIASTIVLLGTDGDNKPHAARFEQRYHAAALRAATLMGLRVVTVGDDPDVQKAASQLPFGKIFATGRGLVPLVKRALYDKLVALVGTEREVRLDDAPHPTNDAPTLSGEPQLTTEQPAASAATSEAAPLTSSSDSCWSTISRRAHKSGKGRCRTNHVRSLTAFRSATLVRRPTHSKCGLEWGGVYLPEAQ